MTRIRSSTCAALLAAILILASGGPGTTRPPRAAAAAVGHTLVVGSIVDPDTLNPWFTGGNPLDIDIFDALLSVDPHGRLQPALATSVAHSPDGRTWTFHLRHGVKRADGQPFTSADVAYDYHAIVDPKSNVPVTAGWNLIDRASTPDAYTFVCHLTAVSAPFLANVGLTAILPAHIYGRPGLNLQKTPFNRIPFGTGPFRVSA